MKRKNSLITLLMLLLVLVLLPASASAAESGLTPWDGTADDSWYDSSKTEFEISTPEQLAGLRALMQAGDNFSGKTVTLTADLDLGGVQNPDGTWGGRQWQSIVGVGPAGNWSGVFDGGGHKLYNVYQDSDGAVGIFNEVKGEVRNLTVESGFLRTTAQNYTIGAIATTLSGSMNSADPSGGRILNCINKADIENPGGGTIGGIVGVVSQGAHVLGCANYGDLNNVGQNATGGIVGLLYTNILGQPGSSVVACANYGSVSARSQVGGIVGRMRGDARISDCYNAGEINATTRGKSYLGGIVGEATDDSCTVYSCYNVGPLKTASARGTNIGLLAGTNNIKFYGGCMATPQLGIAPLGTNPDDGGETTAHYISVVSAEQLKASAGALGSAFEPAVDGLNGGYPVLTWQQGGEVDLGEDDGLKVAAIIDCESSGCTVIMDRLVKYSFFNEDSISISAVVSGKPAELLNLEGELCVVEHEGEFVSAMKYEFLPLGAFQGITYIATYNNTQTVKQFFNALHSNYWLDYRADSYAGGSGTMEDPYIIETPEQLALLAYECHVEYFNAPKYQLYSNYQNGSYRWVKLAADLDMSAKRWSHPSFFMGYLDGQGHTIEGLHGTPLFERTMSVQNKGSFTSAIVNLTLKNADITMQVDPDEHITYAGMLVNQVTNTNFINCAIVDSRLSAPGCVTGGMIGDYKINSTFGGCQIMGCSLDNVTINGDVAGGMIGYLNTGNTGYGTLYVRDSYVRGDISGMSSTGGLIGSSQFIKGVIIDNSYWEVNTASEDGSAAALLGSLAAGNGPTGGSMLGSDGYQLNGVFILGGSAATADKEQSDEENNDEEQNDEAKKAAVLSDNFLSVMAEGKARISRSVISDGFMLNGKALDKGTAQTLPILSAADFDKQEIWEDRGYDFSEVGLWRWNEQTKRPEIKHEWLDFSIVVVTRQPESPVVYRNLPGYMATAALGGLGEVRYQWQYMQPDSAKWKNVEGATGKTLQINYGDGYSDQTKFRCEISDLAGRTAYTDIVYISFATKSFDLERGIETVLGYYRKGGVLDYECEAIALAAAGVDPGTFKNKIGSKVDSISYTYYAMLDHLLLGGDVNDYTATGGGFSENWDWFDLTYEGQKKYSYAEGYGGRVYVGSSLHSTPAAILAMDIFAHGMPWGNEDSKGLLGRDAAIDAFLRTEKPDKAGYPTLGDVDKNIKIVDRPQYYTQSEAVMVLARLWDDPKYGARAKELLPQLLDGMIYDYESAELILSQTIYGYQRPRVTDVVQVSRLVSALVAGASRVDDPIAAEKYMDMAAELIDIYILPSAAIGGGFRRSLTANVDAVEDATAAALMALADYRNKSCFLADYVYDIPAEKAVELDLARLSFVKSVSGDLTLRTEGYYGTTITWQTSNAGAISTEGTVTRTNEEQNVTLTATVTKGECSGSKTFDLMVRPIGLDSKYDVEEALAEAGRDMWRLCELISSLELPEPLYEGVEFSYVCSDPSVIAPDGTLTRPEIGHPNVTVTVSLMATKDGVVASTSPVKVLVYSKSDLTTQEGKLREGYLGSRVGFMNYRMTNGYWDVFAAYAVLGDYIVGNGFSHTLPQPDPSWYGAQYGAMVMAICAIGENPYNYRGVDWVELLHENYGGMWAANLYSALGMEAAGANPSRYKRYDPEQAARSGVSLAGNLVMGVDIGGWAMVLAAEHMSDPTIAGYRDGFVDTVLYDHGPGQDGGIAGTNYISTGCVLLGIAALEWAGYHDADPFAEDLKHSVTGKGPIDAVYDVIWAKNPTATGSQLGVAFGDLYNVMYKGGAPSWLSLGVSRGRLNTQIAKAENLLEHSEDYPAGNVSRLRNALENVRAVSEARLSAKVPDWGKEYYDLYDAVRYINSGGGKEGVGDGLSGIGSGSGAADGDYTSVGDLDVTVTGTSVGAELNENVEAKSEQSEKDAQTEDPAQETNAPEGQEGEGGNGGEDNINGDQPSVTVFEIVKETIKNNPILTAVTAAFILFIIAAAGLNRYRRSR